jgi:protein TonB
MQSFYARTGVLVLFSHILILLLMFAVGHTTVEKQPNLVLSGEIIELESVVSSKTVARRSTTVERISKSIAMTQHASSDGYGLSQAQVQSATAAPISIPSADSPALNNPKPPYPISSRENGEQGRVYLSACVTEHGKIDRLDLAKSSGFHALDRSALNTVRHWKFIPAHQNGMAIAMCYRLPIHFVLSRHHNLY